MKLNASKPFFAVDAVCIKKEHFKSLFLLLQRWLGDYANILRDSLYFCIYPFSAWTIQGIWLIHTYFKKHLQITASKSQWRSGIFQVAKNRQALERDFNVFFTATHVKLCVCAIIFCMFNKFEQLKNDLRNVLEVCLWHADPFMQDIFFLLPVLGNCCRCRRRCLLMLYYYTTQMIHATKKLLSLK